MKKFLVIGFIVFFLCGCGDGGGGSNTDITSPSFTVNDYSGKYVNVPLTLGLELNQVGTSSGSPITGNGCISDSTFGFLTFSVTGKAFWDAAYLTLRGACPNNYSFLYFVNSTLDGTDLVSSPSTVDGLNCYNQTSTLPTITTQKIETSLTCSDF